MALGYPQKAGDFHRYNYRMDVAADLDREASYAFGNRISLTTGNTSTAWAANFFSIPHRRLSSRRGRRQFRRGHRRRVRHREVDRFRALIRIVAPWFRSATSAPFALSVPTGLAKRVRMGLELLA
jgi:hypothetical protein